MEHERDKQLRERESRKDKTKRNVNRQLDRLRILYEDDFRRAAQPAAQLADLVRGIHRHPYFLVTEGRTEWVIWRNYVVHILPDGGEECLTAFAHGSVGGNKLILLEYNRGVTDRMPQYRPISWTECEHNPSKASAGTYNDVMQSDLENKGDHLPYIRPDAPGYRQFSFLLPVSLGPNQRSIDDIHPKDIMYMQNSVATFRSIIEPGDRLESPEGIDR